MDMKKNILIWGAVLAMMFLPFGKAEAQHDINQVRAQSVKYQRLMALIDAFYVDTVNLERLTEDAIVKVLSDLDPHSVYISAEDVKAMNEPLEGGFYGIGIQFAVLRDTLVVQDVVAGGPSEKVGLRAGDRIVAVEGENIAGKKMTYVDVHRYLKGEKGTVVNITVLRGADRLDFRIVRDKIPLYSVDAAYMLDASTGYIKVSRFAATTIEEFETALRKLKAQGLKDLILDLEGNGGGYMGAALGICDHFLKSLNLIVYTDGISSGRRDEFASSAGLFEDGRLVVLIDGNSASASEIVSGAVQDWDRGLIVGRRSFGKGLVQRQYPLTDGSMIRLTTAHYYTPSGRCIQKPYDEGGLAYEAEYFNRYTTGELLSADSIVVNDSLKYFTKVKHRTVYGGGGIIPDVFVPIDTSVNYLYFNRLVAKNVIGDYVNDYIDKHRSELQAAYPDFAVFRRDFVVTDAMIDEIVEAGAKAGVEKDEKLLTPVLPSMKLQLKALLARDLWDMNEMYQILNEDNDSLRKALEVLRDGTYSRLLE